MDTDVYYDDDDNCEGDTPLQEMDYDFEDDPTVKETLEDLYNNCLDPTVLETAKYLFPLFLTSIIFGVVAKSGLLSCKSYHILSTLIGAYIIRHYLPECFYLLIIFIVASYFSLYFLRKKLKGFLAFFPSFCFILFCEFFLESVIWHKTRGILMVAVMKSVSIAIDGADTDNFPSFYKYVGYMYAGASCFFGPWMSFKDYKSVYEEKHHGFKCIALGFGHFAICMFFLSVSSCWAQWFIPDSSYKWLLAYRDALSFRSSHYFVSFAASSILLFQGYPSSMVTITRPLQIEFPRSLVQVVISWNVPMHFWLKTYTFRPSRRFFGKFGAILMTYVTSSLLHGLNFQLAAVLLSLGLYTYIEFQVRSLLSSTFDACISSKSCTKDNCNHMRNSTNCWWVFVTNLGFSAMAVFHLAYLGLMFDTSDIQETGYNFSHTIDKWSQLGFASHWVAFATYIAYFLIR